MRILAVVVLYKRSPEDSETVRSLVSQFGCQPALLDSIGIFIWDNSPAPIGNPALPFPADYRWTGQNVGVSGAYNRAAELAEANGCPWLLLLDHDTILPDNFLTRMVEYSEILFDKKEIAAVAPFVRMPSREVFFSPMRIGFLDRSRPVDRDFAGICEGKVCAINSGTLLRVSALRSIGGYNEDFWLDLSDFYVFHQLHRAGWRLYVAGDLELRHSCAMMDYAAEMTPQRYRAFLLAEDAYFAMYKSRLENAIHLLQLLVRAYRQYSRYENKIFSRMTLAFSFLRMRQTRAERLRAWRRSLAHRRLPASPGPKADRLHALH